MRGPTTDRSVWSTGLNGGETTELTALQEAARRRLERQVVAERLSRLSEDERDWWQERTAILEYDGGYTREAAERLAWQWLDERRRSRGR